MRVCGSTTHPHRLFAPLTLPPNAPANIPSPSSTLVLVRRTFCSGLISTGLIQSFKKQRWNLQSHPRRADHGEGEEEEEEEEEVERPVHCEVEVISWRERRIRAKVLVQADIETVWGVLTDYERLADFIPNLIYSGRIPCPHQGRIWVEQRGLQRALYWHIEARVVLDLQESTNLDNEGELQFTMVDGDFKKFEGKWSLKTSQSPSTTILTYEVNVMPRFNFPAIFLERIIRSDLPVNLRAVACRAERIIEDRQMPPLPLNDIGSSVPSIFPSQTSESSDQCKVDVQNSEMLEDTYAGHVFGHVPSARESDIEFNSKWGILGNVCKLDRPCMADEVHLRRFDGLLENGGSHRCVVASITVKAPVHKVWNVLTAYETLPEIVPNLAISKILLRDNCKVRILQEGCKGLLYMVLHARVVLDLHEKHEEEISFEQVEGDFDSFRGKWLLEQLGDQHTLLKYSVESKMFEDSFLSEAIVEEVVYEDLPSNLCAIRDFIENTVGIMYDPSIKVTPPYADDACITQNTQKENISCAVSSNPLRQKSKVPGLQKDFEVLKAEIANFISKNGQEGFMPMRKQLRLHGRLDIEKAVARMGGFRKVASLMDLSLAYKDRKQKGYWDNLENLQEEISRFQRHWHMDPTYMPSRKSFERAGRYDIARALEKWGGLREVSRLLSLQGRHPRRKVDPTYGEIQLDSSKVSDDPQDQQKTSHKPRVSLDAQKWLTNLKNLNINWVN